MVSQAKGGCKECGSMTHTLIYHNRRPIKRTRIDTSKYEVKNIYIDKKGIIRAGKKPKVKRVSRSQLVKKLDSIFSQYIRQKESVDGMGRCVTCGDTKPWQQQQNGHFYTRGRYPTRWDEDNCHIQCVACNVFKKGNYIAYTMYMIDRYGREYVDNLEIKSKSTAKITSVELQEMIEKYKSMTKNA